jgi:lysosomal alpha-mannosidase
MKALIMMLFVFSVIKAEIINVHIVPHTHDDAGWLYTMDEYYYGNNNMRKCVKCILDNMLISLAENDKRKFTYVEMSFFEKWFSSLEEIKKEEVRKLVKEKRLEFINGGWVMNDEAASNYQDIIDQMRLGLHFLEKEFQVRPRTAWYIDPFGHSKTNVI